MTARAVFWLVVLAALGALVLVLLYVVRERGVIAVPSGQNVARESDNIAESFLVLEAESETTEIERADRTMIEAPVRSVPTPLTIRLVDPSGEPLDRASWVAFRNGEVLASGKTSIPLEVAAQVPPQQAGFEFAAVARGYLPIRVAIAPTPYEQVLAVSEGAAVAGIVRVDGVVPKNELALWLHGSGASLAREDLPQPVADALHLNSSSGRAMGATIDSGGAFRFEGLPIGWRGELRWSRLAHSGGPPAHDVAQTPDRQARIVTAPDERIVLELETPPALVGRIVSSATGDPIEHPHVRASWAVGASGQSISGHHGKDGSICIVFEQGLPDRVTLSVGNANGAGMKDYFLEIPVGSRMYEAGVLSIADDRQIPFRVIDTDGAPIPGAKVTGSPSDSIAAQSVEADIQGSGMLLVGHGARYLVASAFGFGEARAPLPAATGGGSAPVELILAGTTELALVLPSGARELGVVLEFGNLEPFISKGEESWSPAEPPVGASSFVRRGPGGFAYWAGAADGRYVVSGLRSGLVFEVAASDKLGTRVCEREVAPLAPGEKRTVTFDWAGKLRGLSGRVVGPNGVPVPEAKVAISAAGQTPYYELSADTRGYFAVDALVSDSVVIDISAEGFPVRRFLNVQVDGFERDFPLEMGREVRVTVIGPTGKAVEGVRLEPSHAADGWWRARPSEKSPGVFVIHDAPQHAIDMFIVAGGRRLLKRIGASEGALRVELDDVQECTVVLTGWIELAEGAIVLLVPSGDYSASLRAIVGKDQREVHFSSIYPGEYEATVLLNGASLCEPVTVRVQADKHTRVEVSLRAP